MGFLDIVSGLIELGVEKIQETNEKYEEVYNDTSERYANMSDERLERELERLKNDHYGDHMKKMTKIKAMKDELDRRR